MSQILHIFRKDIRHHWIEILLCQAALVAFCWKEAYNWRERPILGLGSSSTVVGVLLFLSWGILIFRMVQSESLVGDRQFWITRPYEWKKLLGEKILFVLVFINLPLLIADAILLILAGFSPVPHIAGLLWMQLLLIQIPFIPVFALASVTRNLAQALLALLAVLVFGAGNIALDSVFSSAGMPLGDVDWLAGTVLVIVCFAAIGSQYARRNTGLSRTWLVGGALAMVIIWLVGAFVMRTNNTWPLPIASQPLAFHAELDPLKLPPPTDPPEKDKDIEIGIPIRSWGLPGNSLGWISEIKLTLEAPDGFRWDSEGRSYHGLLGPQGGRWREDFSVTSKIYERMKSAAVKARISMKVKVYREHDFEVVTATAGEFDVPKVGRCHVSGKNAGEMICLSPLLKPSMVVVRVDPATSSCPRDPNQPPSEDGIPYSWESGSTFGPAEYGISPVLSFSFYFRGVNICPGTPISFSLPQFSEDVRSGFEMNKFSLEEYRQPNFLKGLQFRVVK